MGEQGDDWWRATTIYQAYPRSFADSNGDGIGDLRGLIEHLDHLVDLGVGTLWVSPFFASPQRDVGYDISDYRSVAPEYGTVDDAVELIESAHARGLRVLFDLVLNHTSDEHPWFVESRSSPTGPFADWYVWADGRPPRPWTRRTTDGKRTRRPNNWRSELQLTPAWQWSPEREQWYLATFLPFQPDLNWRNPALRTEMFDTVATWLRRGVDGFRLDIFGSILHDEHLRPNRRRPTVIAGMPRVQTPNRTLNTDDTIAFAAELRAVCDEVRATSGGDHRVLLGEVFGSHDVLRRYLDDDGRRGLDLVFLFDFLAAPYRADRLRALIEGYERAFAAPLLPVYVLENHDRTRSLSRLGGDLATARVMATLLCTLRGVPVIYQGQEIGMTNHYIPLRDAVDPVPAVTFRHLPEALNRRLTERPNRDEVRTPMQWTAGPNAGFCPPGVTPWLPVDDNRATRNVADQRGDPASLLSWYRELLALRRDRPALHDGDLRLLDGGADVVAVERVSGDDRVQVYAHLGATPTAVTVAPDTVVLAASDPGVRVADGRLHLPAHSSAVLGGEPPPSGGGPERETTGDGE